MENESKDTRQLGLIAMPGTEEFCDKVDNYLRQWHETGASFKVPVDFVRFTTGDGKAVMEESVRGMDLFIVSDPQNYSVTYKMHNLDNHMSPDDHFQDVKRVISAINGKAARISVMMTVLYGGRQDVRNMRESLDGAMALKELESFGVRNVITFDAHEPKVQNAIPLLSFDNFYPIYQMLKSFVRNVPDADLTAGSTIVVAPDAGSIRRCNNLVETLGLDLGMFYKQRDLKNTVDGNNKIMRHEYIGNSVLGMDVIMVEDIIATGGSMIDSFAELKRLGAGRVFAFVTFGVFTKGFKQFDEAYEKGLFDKIFITNLTYHKTEGRERPYIVNVDMSKYAAYIIDSIYNEISISHVIDPSKKIRELMGRVRG
ncbi:MAG: ribose-phosphate diphosphokinase [Defluviitaleaceae bacterium]|nr:ribose-phosphate diphosphokinase [Defluviitaleaceae bacterium]